MRVVQVLTTLSYGDAVSNDVLALNRILRKRDYVTEIFAEHISDRCPYGIARDIQRMPLLREEDILIYHASTGTKWNRKIATYGGKLVVWYHNVTPPEFFEGYSRRDMKLVTKGRRDISALSKYAVRAVADSYYNAQDLARIGYRCPVDVIPVAIPWEDYELPDDPETLRRLGGGRTKNILFVGRIAPNKKQENLISAFYYYQKNYEPDARLILCGSDLGMTRYREHLENYAQALGIADRVVFPGHISFQALLTYYKRADLLLCMSEHEGFCVPVVEAMHFRVPVIAYRSSAVAETLGAGGLLLESRRPELAAAAMNRVLTDDALQAHLREKQAEEMRRFAFPVIEQKLMKTLAAVGAENG